MPIFTFKSIRHHRKFLRFAFGGKANQSKVLPFGLALAPRMFTKCMDEAPGHSCTQLPGRLAHTGPLQGVMVLHHIRVLGLRMNTKKKVLTPSRQTVFLGVHLDSVQMQARLAPARISSFNTCLARFKLGYHVSVSTCRRHMRPFLWWMKLMRIRTTGLA